MFKEIKILIVSGLVVVSKFFTMSTKTMSYFRNLIIVENFFCVSRPYLIEDYRTRLICNYISIGMIIIITCCIITDIVSIDLGIGYRIFEIVIGFEFFGLAIGSRFQQAVFGAIDRLDEKCGVDEDYGSKIRVKTVEMIFIFLTSVIIDFVGLVMLGTNTSFAVFLCVAFAAHDAEMAFPSLLIQAVNLRLGKLKDVLPNTGSRVYRHILIAIAHISEQCTSTLLLMLIVTLITAISYEFSLVIADHEILMYLSFYLIWRESRSMYSLWMVCSAVAGTESICKDLALYLAGKLTQVQNKEKDPSSHKILQRWYSIVVSQRPQYISGSTLSIGRVTPIIVLDLSINYMLIMVQMYLAYK